MADEPRSAAPGKLAFLAWVGCSLLALVAVRVAEADLHSSHAWQASPVGCAGLATQRSARSPWRWGGPHTACSCSLGQWRWPGCTQYNALVCSRVVGRPELVRQSCTHLGCEGTAGAANTGTAVRQAAANVAATTEASFWARAGRSCRWQVQLSSESSGAGCVCDVAGFWATLGHSELLPATIVPQGADQRVSSLRESLTGQTGCLPACGQRCTLQHSEMAGACWLPLMRRLPWLRVGAATLV